MKTHASQQQGGGMPNSVVGLDISTRRLLAAEVSGAQGKHPKLVRIASIDLPYGAARDSEVQDIPAVSAALTELWAKAKFRTKRVVLGVGNQRVLVRELETTQMPASQLREALRYQVGEMLPVPVNETILDYYPIEEVPDSAPPRMRGLLVAALKSSVETDVATLLDAGLRVVGVDLSPFAMLRALSKETLSGTKTVVMLGARTTYIVVVSHGVPQFVRILPAGGEDLTDAIVNATGHDRTHAEQLKQKFGIVPGDDPQVTSVTTAAFEAFRGILGSIRSTNTYFTNNTPDGKPIEQIILLGREASWPGISQATEELVGVPVVSWSPRDEVHIASSVDAELREHHSADLAIAVGLALGNR
jgi:type IV pilus assembly protein PilM